jgi:L-iditol 2-dehydrogenase
MKAWVWKGVNDIVLDRNYPDPVAKPGWVVIKVLSAGVCSTDVGIVTGKFDAGSPPAVLGHEICGEIVVLGDGVTAAKTGERVVVETSVACGFCPKCRSGNKHLCMQAGEIGFPPFDGGYAEYVAVPQGCVRRIPDSMTNEQGAILEASICPFGAIYRQGMQLNETVLVQGVGVAGLSFIQAAKCHSAKKIIAAARNPVSLAIAKKFGADVTVSTKTEDLRARVMEETGGEGVDLSIDAAGAAATIGAAVELTAKGGRCLLYGIPADDADIKFPVKTMIFRQITVTGGTNNELAWVPLIDLIAAGKFNNADMVTHRFGFEELPAALDAVAKRENGLIKAVLNLA